MLSFNSKIISNISATYSINKNCNEFRKFYFGFKNCRKHKRNQRGITYDSQVCSMDQKAYSNVKFQVLKSRELIKN